MSVTVGETDVCRLDTGGFGHRITDGTIEIGHKPDRIEINYGDSEVFPGQHQGGAEQGHVHCPGSLMSLRSPAGMGDTDRRGYV
jgi:hypothetical protein